MAFLFKRNPKTPVDLVRSLNESAAKLDGADPKKHLDECGRYLRQLKAVFLGDDENEPQPELQAPVAHELHASDCLYTLVVSLRKLDFDARKDVAAVFSALMRRRVGSESPTAEYLVHRKPEVLHWLMRGPEHGSTALVCGQILRDCAKAEPVSRFCLNSPAFWNLFRYAQAPTFEVATDTFVTLTALLTGHKRVAADFLARNCEHFTQQINGLIKSQNYVTKRQSVRLLTEVVMQKQNQQFLLYYFDDTASLKIIMMLLSDRSKNVQVEGYHVFKFFIAKPGKSQKISDILIKNKENFVQFFASFDLHDQGPSALEERDYIVHEISQLPDIERVET